MTKITVSANGKINPKEQGADCALAALVLRFCWFKMRLLVLNLGGRVSRQGICSKYGHFK